MNLHLPYTAFVNDSEREILMINCPGRIYRKVTVRGDNSEARELRNSAVSSDRDTDPGLSVLNSRSGGYGDGDLVRGVVEGDDISTSGYGETWGEAEAVVHIRTAPSWLPVANMNGSAAWFQATQVRSPPTTCARTWCRSAPDSRSHI